MKHLKLAWQKWKKIAGVIGNFQVQVLFGILYYLILCIIAIGVRATSDPLKLAKHLRQTNLDPWDHKKEDLTLAHQQY